MKKITKKRIEKRRGNEEDNAKGSFRNTKDSRRDLYGNALLASECQTLPLAIIIQKKDERKKKETNKNEEKEKGGKLIFILK